MPPEIKDIKTIRKIVMVSELGFVARNGFVI